MKHLVLIAVVVLAGSASAQIYTVQSQAQTYTPLSGAGVQTVTLTARSTTFSAPDEGYSDIPLGFTFPYYGQNYTTVHVDSNGFLMFGTSTACSSGFVCYSGSGIPSLTRTPHNVIAPWWQDEQGNPTSGPVGAIRTRQSAGQIEIEYADWSKYTGGWSFSVKVTLTASGLFQVHYGTSTGSTTGATVGWENQTGSAGGNYLNCAATTAACGTANWPTNTLFTIGQPVQPDIVVTAVSIANLTVDATHATFDVTPTFQNYGQNAASPAFAWKAYLSTDKVFDGLDKLVYTSAASVTLTGAGTAGATATATGAADTLTALAPGQYYVLVQADTTNVVTEASETNNVGSTSTYFVNGLDLVATAISGPALSGPGNSMTVSVQWFNQGTQSAGTVAYRVLLSADAVLGNDSVLYNGTRVVTGAETINELVTFTVPGTVPGGDFFYILQIDPLNAITEASETNNFVASTGKVNVKQADLVITGADFVDPITAAPSRVGYFGQPSRAKVTMDNVGGANANTFKVGIIVSTDATLSLLSDTIVFEADVAQVAQGTSFTVDIPFTMPLVDRSGAPFTTGNYYVFAILDSTSRITELNEQNNNLVVNGTVTLRAPAADLTVIRVEAPAAGAVGEILPVRRTLKNIGNVAAPAVKYRFYASANPIITSGDVLLPIVGGGVTVLEGSIALAVGASDTQTELVKVPPSMPPGTYYVGVVVDTGSTVSELDEQNNALSSNAVQIAASSLRVTTQQLPDAPIDRPYVFRLSALGERAAASTWAIDPGFGTLPAGLSLAADGLITGTPTATGVSTFSVVVTNDGRDAQALLLMRVLPTSSQLEITTASVPAVVNDPLVRYQYALGAVGGMKPYQWRLVSGALPQNLTLNPNGVIEGNPRTGLAEAASNVVLEVRDALGSFTQKSISIRVVAPGSIIFRNLGLASGVVGQAYFTDIAIQNADSTLITAMQKPLTWSRQGELPDGLALNPQGDVAVIEGKPLRAGTFTFSLSVEDAKGRNDSAQFTIQIFASRFKLASTGMPELIRPGEAVTFNITAATQASPTFALYTGALAPGLTLAQDGTVSGTVPLDNAEGRYNFSVEAKDSTGATGLGAFSLVVERKIQQGGCSVGTGLAPIWMLLTIALARRRRRS